MADEEIRKLSEGLKRSLSDSGWHPVLMSIEGMRQIVRAAAGAGALLRRRMP